MKCRSLLLGLTAAGALGEEYTGVVERTAVVNCEEKWRVSDRFKLSITLGRKQGKRLTIRSDINLVADTVAKGVTELALAGKALAGDTDRRRGAVRLANLANGTAVVEITGSRTL